MTARPCSFVLLVLALAGVQADSALAQPRARPYRLPAVSLKQPVLWGATCAEPDGAGLAFGGQDQASEDGAAHTRVKVDGHWVALLDELRRGNPHQARHDACRRLVADLRAACAEIRRLYLDGPPADRERELLRARDPLAKVLAGWPDLGPLPSGPASALVARAREGVTAAAAALRADGARPETIVALDRAAEDLDRAADTLGPEPPPRALSPIAYDARTRVYVLFGGDHLDYLANDTWTFDPAARRWQRREPKSAPPPRANHTLRATGDGKVVLAGGYTYAPNTDYMGGQYRDLADGEWTYDLGKDEWTGPTGGAAGAEPNSRTYRTGPFLPEYFLQGPRPDAAAFQQRLAGLPANTWVAVKPPHLPQVNRDWGTAVLDPDRDLVLRFSGGHCAHGGSDVLHYHLASNRWELPFPVEFPLGQLYTNTEYPEGFNFNRRPWPTGHTYQNYGYDPVLKKMLFTGHPGHTYVWDPDRAEWTGRFAKPMGMTYGDCFYTLTLTPTPQGLVCWTQEGRLFQFDAAAMHWRPVVTRGEKLPGSIVDNSTVVHDARRDRLLFFRKPYGDKPRHDGQVYALDRATGEVRALDPKGRAGAAAVPYLCQIRYDAGHDLLLVGGTLPPGEDGVRRTPAYDPAANAWVSLRLGGDDPSGPQGRNVSLGLMYDARRRLFWAVDTHSRVFVLRLDPRTADVRPLAGE